MVEPVPVSITRGSPRPRSYQAIRVPPTGVLRSWASNGRARLSPHPASSVNAHKQAARPSLIGGLRTMVARKRPRRR